MSLPENTLHTPNKTNWNKVFFIFLLSVMMLLSIFSVAAGWFLLFPVVFAIFVLPFILIAWGMIWVIAHTVRSNIQAVKSLFSKQTIGISYTSKLSGIVVIFSGLLTVHGLFLLIHFAVIGGPNTGYGHFIYSSTSNSYTDMHIGIASLAVGIALIYIAPLLYSKNTLESVSQFKQGDTKQPWWVWVLAVLIALYGYFDLINF